MASREPVIYGLVDGDTMELRYIGQTVNREKRLRGHKRSEVNGSKTRLSRWLRKHHWNMIILERDPLDLNEAEMCWIHDMREQGARLINLTDGGGGMLNPSSETRAKMSAWQRGKPRSAETRTKISAALSGKPLSPEHRAKINAALSGKFRGENNPNFGKHHTAKSRAKMSAALRASWALRKENGA